MTIKALATHKVAALLVGVASVIAISFAFAVPAKADTLSDLQAQVQALLAQIATLQGGSTTSTTTTGGTGFTFTKYLSLGKTDAEVKEVQKFLNTHGAPVSATGAGSVGNESSYFGAKTVAAVKVFQTANGISPTGTWGPITRAKANSMNAGSTTGNTGTTTPTGAGVTVGTATQPANSLAPENASRVPFTTFTLTNTSGAAVTINGITVERTGLGSDSVFSGVVLVDNNSSTQIGTSKTLNSNHQAVIGDTFTLNAGETKTFTVAGNMGATLDSYAGQVVSLSVVGINTTATVSGSLPITGAQQTINATLAIGSVSTSSSSVIPYTGTTVSKNIGDTGVKFSGVKFTAGSGEDLKLYSVRFRQVGSVSSADLANVQINVDGTLYPATVDSTGKYYTASFPGGVLIAKGFTKDVYIQGDIVGSNAASRTVDFDIDKVTDVYFVGQTYGYGIAPSGTYTPWYNGDSFSVNGASATTISKATEVAAQNVALNVPNQVLGGYVVDLKGEAISTNSQIFNFNYSAGAASSYLLTNVSLVDETGKVVAGPVDAVNVGGTAQKVTFTDSVTYGTGRHVYTLKGKLPNGVTNGVTITASTTPSGWSSVTGQTTGNSVSLSSFGAFNMNTMTVKAASLAVTVSATPAAQNVVAGQNQVLLANYQFDASQSGEDIRFASIGLTASTSGALSATSVLTACQLFDGTTALNTGANVVNPTITATAYTATAVTFTLDNSFVVPKGTVKTVALKCNVASDATGSFKWGITSTQIGAISATGVTSSVDVDPTGSTNNGQLFTLAAGSFALEVDASSPSYTVVAAGNTGVTAGVVKLRASNENVSLTKLGLVLTSGSVNDVLSVDIYDGATQVGTAYFTSGTSATSTLTAPVTLTKGVDKTLTLKANLAGIGQDESGTAGTTVKIDPLNAEGSGAASGETRQIGGASVVPNVAGFAMYKSFPTLSLVSGSNGLGSTGLADGRLIRFSVTADAKGPVGIGGFTFTVATTSATVTNAALYAYSNSSFSAPISGQGTSGQIGSTISPTSTSRFKIVPSSTGVQVPAGSTYYFELRASVAGVTTGSSVVTTLTGDAASYTISQAAAATTTQSFVWTGNSTTTSTFFHADWANGYGIEGLPASGLIQTRSN